MIKTNRIVCAAAGCFLLLAGLVAARNAPLDQTPSFTAEEWTLPTEPGHLAGTLLVPAGDGPWPVALILAGSGPTDRNGNATRFPGGNNSLKQLAESLAVDGVASLRVDKRGVAGSVTAAISEFDRRFDHFIADAVAWCERLQGDPRFSSLTVVGHSQGAQVGMSAAWLRDADGFVAISGPGRRLVELARLPLPVLVVQGTTDRQVAVTDAENLVGARPGAQLLVVEGMNHLLKMVATDNAFAQQASLVDSTLLIAAEVPAAVADLAREADRMAASRQAARDAVRMRAKAGQRLLAPVAEDSVLAAEFSRETAAKVGLWARRFAAADSVVYLFGPKPGGYVAEGDVVSDRRQDCVSLLYRVGELARAHSAREAVDWALRTRFAGARADAVADGDGRLDYDDPAHLDYSLDMIRTGMWGRNVTETLSGAAPDTVGSSRYAAGSFRYVPKIVLQADELAEGDIVWFVLASAHKSGARLRREYGLVIGHIGIVVVDEDQRWLIHAANSGLDPWYEGGSVVRVPLMEYLSRVDKFAGVMVTRF